MTMMDGPGEPGESEEEANLRMLEAQLWDLAMPVDVVDVTKLSDPELLDKTHEIDSQLSSMGELMNPTTQEGRDLHSKRAALLIEQSARGLR